MAGRFQNPFPQFMDSTPTMLSGAKLFFYAAGTSTKLNTYSDAGLTSANTNPVVLNSSGRPSVDIYLQDLDYKVILAPSTDSDPPVAPIWTADNLNARDSKLIAKTLTGSGSPSGVVAGTAGSASILPDFYWDYTNSILYVCTTTGTTLTAVWTAVNASTAAAVIPPPQGRLTLTSSTPVMTSSATAATAVLYTPYIGNTVPIYNGSAFIPITFSELTLTLASQHAAGTIYDVFIFNNSGVATLVTGPAWGTLTQGSGARGTGAGTTQLSRINGILVNTVQITARNGATTYTVNANVATYLGTILIDSGSAGHVSWTFGSSASGGGAAAFNVWNNYNRVSVNTSVIDSGVTYSYGLGTIRQSRASAGNQVGFVFGQAEEGVSATYTAAVTILAASGLGASSGWGLGYNTTTAFSAISALFKMQNATSDTTSTYGTTGNFTPALGFHVISANEQSDGAHNNIHNGSVNNNLSVSLKM